MSASCFKDEYQYLTPATTQQTTKKPLRRKTVFRRISTTLPPTIITPSSTPLPRQPTIRPFEKVSIRNEAVQDLVQSDFIQKDTIQRRPVQNVIKVSSKTYTRRPAGDYDYYDESHEKVAVKYAEETKVILHAKGKIECLDVGNFPHPTSCKKFISCARIDNGSILGWEYICPKGLSFDPVGGICNWSAGLGCSEKDL